MPILELGNSSRRSSCRASLAGFSLLEMLLVMALIAIIMGSFLAGVWRDSARVLVIEANRLQSVLEQLTYQALITGEPHGVVLTSSQVTKSSAYLPVVWRDKKWIDIDLPGITKHQIEAISVTWNLSGLSSHGAPLKPVWKVSPQGMMDAGVFYFYDNDLAVLLRIGEDGAFTIFSHKEVPEGLNHD